MAEAAKKTTAKKTAAKKTAVPAEPSPPVESSAPPGDSNTPSQAVKQAENWVSTNNGVRFGRR